MDAAMQNLLVEGAKMAVSVLAVVGGLLSLTVQLASKATNTPQNSKAVLDVLDAAIAGADEDAKYRKFLEDLRKERTASVVFGRPVRTSDLNRLMDYYDHGFATASEIGLAWEHRTRTELPLSFRPNWFGRWIVIPLMLVYILLCFLGGLFAVALLLYLPLALALQTAGYALLFFALSFFTYQLFRSDFTAFILGGRETRHARAQS